MKKSYSVKEAASLLDVSTNTIYTYLKEGKIAARRIGKGRFKIPYASLTPYIGLSEPFAQKKKAADKISEEESILSVGVGDIAFYRLFKALIFLGTGAVYLATNPFSVSTSRVIGLGADEFLINILPFLLILSGFIALIGIAHYSKLKPFQGWIHVLMALMLGYYSLLAIFTQNFGILVFIGSLLAVTILHFFSGTTKINNLTMVLRKPQAPLGDELNTEPTFSPQGSRKNYHILAAENVTFFSQFTKYSIFLVVLGGIVITLLPEYMPFAILTGIIETNRGLFAMLWFGTFIPSLIYLLKNKERSVLFLVLFYALTGVFSLAFSAQLTINANWDVSYISFITGIFAIFLALWHVININLDLRRLDIFVIAFVWIALSFYFGLFTLRSYHEQIKNQVISSMGLNLETTANKISNSFDNQSATLKASVTNPAVKEAVLNKKTSYLTTHAKDVYESVGVSQRVVFYDSQGVSVGIYPHLSMGLGTDFSERDFFQKTKMSYKTYISNVFKDIIGESTVVQTEPIFENNQFIGMIGLFISLDKLADRYVQEYGKEFNLQAIDENGVIIFSSDKEKIGMNVEREEFGFGLVTDTDRVWAQRIVRNPNWELYVDALAVPSVRSAISINIAVILLAVINAFLSVSIALVLSLKNGFRGLNTFNILPDHKTAGLS